MSRRVLREQARTPRTTETSIPGTWRGGPRRHRAQASTWAWRRPPAPALTGAGSRGSAEGGASRAVSRAHRSWSEQASSRSSVASAFSPRSSHHAETAATRTCAAGITMPP
ncbi:hypothetical protein ACFQ0B_69810 [Nonomuraea thailandensis]